MGTTRPLRPGCRAESRVTERVAAAAGRIGIELIGEARPAEPEVEAGQGVQVSAQCLGVGSHVGGELVEDPLLLRLGRQLRLAPRVGQLDRHERLHEEGLPAARLVVDDAPDPALGIGPHRHHVAAVAQRDERLLQGPREVRVDERLEPAAQPFVGQPHRPAQAAQRRRGRVEDLAGRVDAGLQPGAQGRHGVQAAVQRVEQRPLHLAQRVGQAAGRHERLHDGPQLRGVEATGAHSARHDGPDVPRPADADVRPHREQPASLVGLVETTGHDDRVRRGLDGQGQSA